MMKRFFTALLTVTYLASVLTTGMGSALTGSEFQAGRIMDDSKFFSAPTMSVADLQTFLNAKMPACDTNGSKPYASGNAQTRAQWAAANAKPLPPYTCLKDYRETTVAKPAEAGLCKGYVSSNQSAAEIIYNTGLSCGVNPQVLIVLLQKEQALVTDDWPWPIQYRAATGFGCPDTAECDSTYYGFFNQVYNAARQFKRYAKDSQLFNYRSGMNNYVQYNPNASCGGTTVSIQNQTTAGLYNYTPYQPNASALANLYGSGDGCGAYGNRNFWRLFNDWFGSTYGPPDYSCKFSSNVTGAATGTKVVPNQTTETGYSQSTLIFPNNTGSACIEAHTWSSTTLQSWSTNVATNHPAVDPANGEVISGNISGDRRSELIFVKYLNTGSGNIEIHTWDSSYQKWVSNVATNMPSGPMSEARIIASDTNGDGIDELLYVKYRNTGSGRIEVHTWAPGQQRWITNIATNMPSAESDNGYVISGNIYNDTRDELIFVKYQNTGSGRIELHTWALGQQSWLSNVASNHAVIAPLDGEIFAGNIYGSASDELVFAKYQNTGSGRIELHTWAPGQQSWLSNVASNLSTVPI